MEAGIGMRNTCQYRPGLQRRLVPYPWFLTTCLAFSVAATFNLWLESIIL